MKRIESSTIDSICGKLDIMEQLDILTELEQISCWIFEEGSDEAEFLNPENIEKLWIEKKMPELKYYYDSESDDMLQIWYIDLNPLQQVKLKQNKTL